MGLTVARDKDPLHKADLHAVGDMMMSHGTVTFDNSYPTGGEAVTAANLGFTNHISEVFLQATGAEVPVFDKTNSKILLYTADGTQAANASDQSAVVVRYMAFGR